MKIEQRKWTEVAGWSTDSPGAFGASSQMVLVFGATAALRRSELVAAIRQGYPAAWLLGCSTAGEICGTTVLDDSLVVTAVHFEHTLLHGVEVNLGLFPDSLQAGEWIAQNLPHAVRNPTSGMEEKLVHVMVLTDGLKVNGSDFVAGVTRHLPEGVTITGGLAGDGSRFGETLVFHNNVPEKNAIAALGLYGDRLNVGIGSLGGWDSFGPERLITRSEANVLYELDGRSALGLYKQYLGTHADGLPATGLLFPLSVRTRDGETSVVRTILSVDEDAQSLTFAGDIPQGAYARLMKANFDRLIDGAAGAAGAVRASFPPIDPVVPELAILISCVGRKLVLKQRVEEEVEAVNEVLGGRAALAGFYSYGEISPFTPGAKCELHNQTMTVTTLSER